jgi:transposase
MPKPYSYDLRQKVVQAIKLDGLKISEASQIFSISRDTIRLWSRAGTRNWGLSSVAE